ncbi:MULTISPECIES: hypothetical protein [Microcystis]|uniref:Uncharacterized protein n=1 Tax=Microcystis panniformis FACHB-1757 TaxID=1638788 RepID=A0A0K1RWX3_9CHRO|nr:MULTISPECIES: hypothetical protein [Microcystis]AKV66273.1 hypothetical protein VL20_1088 [Microcystis panniformis FACHB-1757]
MLSIAVGSGVMGKWGNGEVGKLSQPYHPKTLSPYLLLTTDS